MQDFGGAAAVGALDALDAVDQALVHALQISPRASWARIAEVLELDAVTLARRWARLSEQGAAWISCYPGPMLAATGQGCLAFVELDCAKGGLLATAAELAHHPRVSAIEHMTGGRDLLITVLAADLAALSGWITEVLGSLPGVTASRSQLAVTFYSEGSHWRLRALSPSQVERLAQDQPAREDAPAVVLTELDRRIITQLSADGRASFTALAERCGSSPDTVRRRTRRLFAAGAVQARCELARPLSHWPVALVLWARASAEALGRAARTITGMREVRLCAGITGRDNLLIVAWVRSVDDTQRFEAQVVERVPGLVIGDRAVALRQLKLSGHLLDRRGYRESVVAMDGWSASAP